MRLLIATTLLLIVAPSQAAEPVWKHGAVAADHPLASQAGVEILKKGGNVVDAAVAVGFAQSVLRPGSSGLGGGGFMVIWNAERGSATTLDYRERAPAAATRDLFTRPGPDGRVASSRNGGRAIGVPGHVAGLCYTLEKFGSMTLAEVLAPAIRLAETGVPLDEHEVSTRRRVAKVFIEQPAVQTRFPGLWQGYLLKGELKVGTMFRSPQLPALQALAKDGVESFYRGEVARAIVAEVQKHGGIITAEDLVRMDVVERKPLSTTFDGMRLFSMPPTSSGGVALFECLNILSSLEKTKLGGPIESLGHNSPEYLHVLAESMKHAFADRAAFLGDPDFADIPVGRLTSPQYGAALAKRIQLDRTRPLEDYGRFLPVEDAGTTHFSVIDSKGNAVACTETINTSFGSFVVEPRFGIVLNNEMDDFAARPGKPNAFGLVQSEANAVGPRHRPLSSMTPTIAVRDGKAVFALGASGGPRIISTTLQVLLNLSRFEMDPEEAVTRARAHHQWLPNELYLEPKLMKTAQAAMKKRQHTVKSRSALAVCQVVARTPAGLKAKSDPRKHGQAAGY
jgi:gamma-glutamyltranspeptidase/glutathione hydrolase